jgi:hypothetical protein
MTKAASRRWDQMRERQLQSPEAREQYERARRVLDTIQSVLATVDAERERANLPKAALACRIGAQPAAVQRPLRSGPTDPALKLLLEMADSLGLELRLQRRELLFPPQRQPGTATMPRAQPPALPSPFSPGLWTLGTSKYTSGIATTIRQRPARPRSSSGSVQTRSQTIYSQSSRPSLPPQRLGFVAVRGGKRCTAP